MTMPADPQDETLTERQQAVLDAVLALMVEQGGELTMNAVARRASCSKESLYKWFGDRDGLLTATVRWQASKVRAGNYDRTKLDALALRDSLTRFATNWLGVISSPTSIALNRFAIAQAETGGGKLGAIMLANGRFAIGARLKPVLDAGREAGLIAFDDTETAFRSFIGLVGRDVQIRLLLGDTLVLTPADIERDAARATEQFLALYGRANPMPASQKTNA
ncbi:TetR family transcriptional regulator [Ancylobacter aquaticus]|uniref:TetR family transcriptional regulator n=1 Tax=Ancylobacter aquaticus TaxID=100 RepID=A0A4R1IC75_ANCAQ|nr:TetR/AcrR family transcriptional regulator C-terminal domain-containing protein [Ancylobacter aquaticus]TCK30789.1 TetR family transcriptional regulator [Ancylobacter aquaticus]